MRKRRRSPRRQLSLDFSYDAQQAMWAGRAFPQTNVGWENILAGIGQACKEWFRGENGMDAHIAKPVQIDTLKSTVRQVPDRRMTGSAY